jgi:8-hydroxy-5-deazaflavin:NADPH oxidoreductase
MQIGIIGAGRVGQAVATRLVTAGHGVMLSDSGRTDALTDVVEALGQNAHAGTVQDAAAYGEVVFVAIPEAGIYELPAAELDGKIVVDATNYSPQRDGRIPQLDDGSISSSELVARHLPGARVVKAFNTMSYVRIAREGKPRGAAERLAIPLAGDDPTAKAVVGALIDDMGFDPVDAGTLGDGRNQQPGTAVWDVPLGAQGVRAALANP